MINKDKTKKLLEKSKNEPKWWCENILGFYPWYKQTQIMESVRDFPETAVASCHGMGKSAISAAICLWYLYTHPHSIVISTAPTARQVKKVVWSEISRRHSRSKHNLGGILLQQELKLSDDWWAIGFTASATDGSKFQGFHAEEILVVIDEAYGVSSEIYEAIDGILTTEKSRLLTIGNPTGTDCNFFKQFRSTKVNKFNISVFDTPNFTEFGIVEEDFINNTWKDKVGDSYMPRPYLVTPFWVENKAMKWGTESPIYKSKVLGQFPEAGDDTLIPLGWVERANNRASDGIYVEGEKQLGCDIARYGTDESIYVLKNGNYGKIYKTLSNIDTMENTGEIIHAKRETGSELIRVDADGLGSGVYDRLKELNEPVIEMRSGHSSKDKDRFANKRAEWWWNLRNKFEKDEIAIEYDEELCSQLSNIKYKINSRGQIVIESKDEMKKRGVHSPDRADALMLAFADEYNKKVKLKAYY